MNEKTENIVKVTAKRLGMTYKQLGEEIGYSEGALRNAATADNVSDQITKAIDLFLKVKELENKMQTIENFKQNLRDLLA